MNIREEFGVEVGKLKRTFAEEYGANRHSIMIIIDQDDNVTIVDANTIGNYVNCHRDWVNTEED